ncbi:unnamed protein product [Camellia sinensis]|uniref:3-oxo-5-alpha-steroid 4-dehydrogenase C-terminal domain-containing protein n=2 Tax=Camellia sinensis TaxID=4442 RepID=A0A4S4D946_CAMSN|nr:hypothetical protein TEA_017924 [Camellia sinensis var. sinensis]
MMITLLERVVYEEPSNLFTMAMPPIIFLSLAILGLAEASGIHLQYSKFCINMNFMNMVGSSSSSSSSHNHSVIKLSSRTGMLIVYTPPFLAGVASFILFSGGDSRFLLVKSALTFHFFKRVMEVLFVHKYSGGMVLDSVILISTTYFTTTSTMIYTQHVVQGFQEPLIDLKLFGVVLFLLGICGNFYHHCLLSKTRDQKGDKSYKIPRGGLFNLVICPHYLFEIVQFLGVSFISQTTFSFAFALGSALYLTGRSYDTRKWYLSKFENFPKHVKALVPYVF